MLLARLLLLSLCAVAGAGVAVAREEPSWLVDRWTVDDGLPVNGVTALLREPGGFLWLTTFDGLTRFDGQRFDVFDSAPALGTRRLVELQRSHDGALWVRSERFGLARFDGRDFIAMDTADGLPDARVIHLFLDTDGALLVATAAGAARWNGRRFETLLPQANLAEVQSIARDADGDLWIGGADGSLRHTRGDAIVQTFNYPHGHFPALVADLHLAPDGAMLAATRVGVARIADGVSTWLPATRDSDSYAVGAYADGRILVRHNDGNLWLASGDDAVGRRESGFPAQPRRLLARAPDGAVWTNAMEYVLRDDQRVYDAPCPIRDLAFDTRQTVWLASACEGLVRLRPRTVDIIGRSVDGNGSSSADAAYGVAQQADGALWISSLGGVERWRDGHTELRLALRPQGNDSARYSGIDSNYLRTVFVDADGSVLIGQRGVCRVEGATCNWPAAFPDALLLEDVRAIWRARDGSLWLGGSRHLWRQSPEGDWQARENAGIDAGSAPRSGMVRTVQEDANGTLWFGTLQDGLWRRTPDDAWTRLGIAQGLPSESIRDLLLDADGTLWIATEDRGLCRRNAASAAIDCVSSAQGLYSDSLHRILDDGHGRLWFNSNRGAFWLTREALAAALDHRTRLHPRGYTRRDGLPNQEGNGGVQGAGLVLADGRIALPTQAGVALFDPDDDAAAPEPPRIAIEAIDLPDGRSLPAAALTTLGRGERSFSMRFAGLSAALADPLYFRYRLWPDSDAWQDVGDTRVLRFSRLPPGDYTVEIAALDATSGVVGASARIAVRLPPWWWETWEFRIGAMAFCVVVAAAWLWRRSRRLQARQQELEARVAERTHALREQQDATQEALLTVQRQSGEIATLAEAKSRFFANVSHELRTPLAVILGPLRDAARGSALSGSRIDAMLRNGHRLERLIEQMLDLERIDARRFPLAPTTLAAAPLLRDAVAAFEPLAREACLALVSQVHADAMLHVDEDQFARVLGNLLSNALKFTPRGGRVDVTLARNAAGDGIRIAVEDSGPGVPEDWRTRIFDRFAQVGHEATRALEGAGLGLALCREIVALHGGRLWVESGAVGARFVLELPEAGSGTRRAPVESTSNPHGVAPVATKTPAGADAGEAPTGDDPADNTEPALRQRVLIAEDNADLRAYLRDILSPAFDVDAAEDGADALVLARERLPDLVVSDLTMPRLDGFGLARALRADPLLRGVPLIFLTARASDADEVAGLDGGADHYIRKPFDAEVLLAHARAALATVRRLRQRFIDEAARSNAPSDIEAAAKTDAGDSGQAAAGQTNEPAPDPFLQRAFAWLDAHLHDENLGPERIAQALHVSRATLDRRFAAHGESLSACLRRLRLERAKALLSNGTGNVSEVAYACGFPSLSAFSHAYRKHHGHAPSVDTG